MFVYDYKDDLNSEFYLNFILNQGTFFPMEELIYTIDRDPAEAIPGLIVKLLVAERHGFTLNALTKQPALTKNRLASLATAKDSSSLPFLIDEEAAFLKRTKKQLIDSALTSLNLIHISPRSVYQALKLLSTTGKVFLDGKPLVIDLHTKNHFHYKIASENGKTTVEAAITSGAETVPLAACSFIGQGSPHCFVKGASLKFFSNDVDWKDLQNAFKGVFRPAKDLIAEADDDEEAPRVTIEGPLPIQQHDEPLPVLQLKDRTGAFADLSMRYGNTLLPYPPNAHPAFEKGTQPAIKRHPAAETAWEKDLLETDFIKKIVAGSHYYCSMDKAAKSLAFLLEIGWEIYDWKGNRVLMAGTAALEAHAAGNSVEIKGKMRYGEFEADLKDIIGAFNKKERFAQIAPGHSALIPPSWERADLAIIAEEAEIESGTLVMKKNRLGAIGALFEANPAMAVGQGLDNLKQSLESFRGIRESDPGAAFSGALRPYQKGGLNWLCFLRDFGFNGMLADDMGLGKTVQVIAFLSTADLYAPVLIVVPTSLLFNWKKELEKFLPSYKVHLHHGSGRTKDPNALDAPQIIITTYATLRLDLSLFERLELQYLILDEAQAIKNASTQSFQAVARLNSPFRLSITGTPVENHLMELWSHFCFLMPDLFGKEADFAAEVNASASDPRFMRRIKRQIRPFVLRRTKEEVAKDLPEKIEQTIWVEMGEKQRELYETYLSGARTQLLEKVRLDGIGKHRMEVLETIMRLKQICCHPLLVNGQEERGSTKLDALMQDLETVVEEGKKALVYSQFTSMLKLIGKGLGEKGWKFVYLDGSTDNREKVVDTFQNDPTVQIFLVSLKAGGVGLNLTAADYVFLYDPWWNSAAENQAIDRAHRIGRKETVIAKRYLSSESIEEKIMKLKEAKSALASGLFDDGAEASVLTADDLLFLLE